MANPNRSQLGHESLILRLDKKYADKIAYHCIEGAMESNVESNHWEADTFLVELLEQLGFKETLKAYKLVNKHYAKSKPITTGT